MNTHQKVFFTVATTLGFAAAAFSATPAPVANAANPVQLERLVVIGHHAAPEVALERALVIGHQTDSMVASNNTKASVG